MTAPVAGGGVLLPCPCCGAAAQVSGEWQDCDGNWAVECSVCNLLSWTPEDWNRRGEAATPAKGGDASAGGDHE